MVELPHPSPAVPWLTDFEDQLFTFPSGVHDDMVDMFSQAIIEYEYFLEAGYHARNG
jgi:phage terminase large subunit-like protein